MRFDNCSAHREPHAHPFARGREEGLEDLRAIILGDARAIVADAERDLFRAMRRFYDEAALGAAFPRSLQGVHDKIDQNLLYLNLIGQDGGQFVGEVDGDRRTVLVYVRAQQRSEEQTSELQSLMRISYAVFCL